MFVLCMGPLPPHFLAFGQVTSLCLFMPVTCQNSLACSDCSLLKHSNWFLGPKPMGLGETLLSCQHVEHLSLRTVSAQEVPSGVDSHSEGLRCLCSFNKLMAACNNPNVVFLCFPILGIKLEILAWIVGRKLSVILYFLGLHFLKFFPEITKSLQLIQPGCWKRWAFLSCLHLYQQCAVLGTNSVVFNSGNEISWCFFWNWMKNQWSCWWGWWYLWG